jgi:hypothetical protein
MYWEKGVGMGAEFYKHLEWSRKENRVSRDEDIFHPIDFSIVIEIINKI